MMVYDQFVVFCFCLEFQKASLMVLELCLKLFSVGILHLKHILVAMTTEISILLNNQTSMDCYYIVTCLIFCSKIKISSIINIDLLRVSALSVNRE